MGLGSKKNIYLQPSLVVFGLLSSLMVDLIVNAGLDFMDVKWSVLLLVLLQTVRVF